MDGLQGGRGAGCLFFHPGMKGVRLFPLLTFPTFGEIACSSKVQLIQAVKIP